MRSISLLSGKGGVGRTTIAVNLGVALAMMKKDVILLDASFTSPDVAFHFKLEKALYTINDALLDQAAFSNVLYSGPAGLRIAPAAVTLEQIKMTKPERLPEVIQKAGLDVDFLIIDASGGLRRETVAAVRSTKEALFIATPDIVSLSDCLKAKLVAEFLGAKSIGLVLNRVRGEDFELDKNEIKEIVGLPIIEIIPEDEKVQQALRKGEPLIVMDPKAPAAVAIEKLAKKISKG
ncbi:MAG: cell division ATPase MinD [Candidatus Hadarchaeales archaeon]